jgi:hypothetical protein
VGDDAVMAILGNLLVMENPPNQLTLPIADGLAAIRITGGYGSATRF